MKDASSAHPLESPLPEISPEQRRASRLKLIAIFAIFAVPLLLASIWLHIVRTSGGAVGDTSRGQLIQPAVPLTEFTLTAGDQAFNLDSIRGLWTLLYVSEGPCTSVCEQNLYHMRQVRLALNHRMDRVQRAFVIGDDVGMSEALLEQHPGLIAAIGPVVEQQALLGQIAAAQASMALLQDAIYLIDPLGNLMLRFSPDLKPEAMLKDLKHLLKVSRIG